MLTCMSCGLSNLREAERCAACGEALWPAAAGRQELEARVRAGIAEVSTREARVDEMGGRLLWACALLYLVVSALFGVGPLFLAADAVAVLVAIAIFRDVFSREQMVAALAVCLGVECVLCGLLLGGRLASLPGGIAGALLGASVGLVLSLRIHRFTAR